MIMIKKQSQYEDFFNKTIRNLGIGSLIVSAPNSKTIEYRGSNSGPCADMIIKDWDMIKQVIKQGEMGFLKAYQTGILETTNLANLIMIAILNETHLRALLNFRGLRKYIYLLYNFFRRNTVRGSRKNIKEHYDLSNDFFSLWLDPSMCYSSGLFSDESVTTLDQAQNQKMARVLDQLNLPQGSHILEIGSGWGAFLLEAAKRDYRVTGITISDEQFAHTKKNIEESSFQPNVNVQLLDYRNIKGQFDGIVSIEMFEAVGEQYWHQYFTSISNALKPGGKTVIQTITIDDDHFETYRKTPDFIQLYIFPGGMLPSKKRFIEEAKQAGLRVVDDFRFGQDYARTLQKWLNRFDDAKEEVLRLGFDEAFIKLWRFYLSYCIAGFTTKRTDVHQFTLEKSD